MFMSKDMFRDDDDDGDSNTRPITNNRSNNNNNNNSSSTSLNNQSSSTSNLNSNVGGESDLPQSLTPAARQKKMAEMRAQQLAKMKNKQLSSGMIRSADVPKPSTQTSQGSLAISPTQKNNKSNNNNNNNNNANNNTNANNTNNDSDDDQPGSPETNNPRSPARNNTNNSEGEASVLDINSLIEEKRQLQQNKQISSAERTMLEAGITPIFDPVKKNPNVTTFAKTTHGRAPQLDLSDLRVFLTSPAPKGIAVQCVIVRNKKGLKNKMYPQYELYLEDNENNNYHTAAANNNNANNNNPGKFLMSAKKRSKNKTSNYMISMDIKNDERDGPNYLGKLRSNFVGTEFVAYDKGINPKEAVTESTGGDGVNNVRQEIGAVCYESNILGSRGPRKMTALVPQCNNNTGEFVTFRSLKDSDSILEKYKKNAADALAKGNTEQLPSTEEYLLLTNKTPKWNDQLGAYVLNFNGRVTMASVKNFQLISPEDQETVLLQFGRVGKDNFTMDFQWPLSPLQAFAICLSSFDYKLACE